MKILGIASNSHDSGIAIIDRGVPIFVVEEERLNRIKKTQDFPIKCLDAVFRDSEIDIRSFEAITLPWDVRQLRRTFLWLLIRRFPLSLSLLRPSAHGPQGTSIVYVWPQLYFGLRKYFNTWKLPPLVRVRHHDSHAASFFISPHEEATVLVMDGYGDDCATSVYTGMGNKLELQWQSKFLNSLGIVYTAVTQYLGFAKFGDEGKVMGLAAYGDKTYVDRFRDVIHATDDGHYAVNMSYFGYDKVGLIQPWSKKFEAEFGPPFIAGEEITDRQRDIAFALQNRLEEIVIHITRRLSRDYPSRKLCLSGGVAMNCVANDLILNKTDYEEIWIPPNASDSGVPMGSALWYYHQEKGQPREFVLQHPYYGLAYDENQSLQALHNFGLTFEKLDLDVLITQVARDLSEGKIVGWFQGRFETGPRALGNRSILADPRKAEMKDTINVRIKHREAFRPFAPAVLAEDSRDYFEICQEDPFMTIAPRVKPDKVEVIPAVVHADNTGRFQTVSPNMNDRYYRLLKEFKNLTGVPVLLNTSFNRQEPIVSSPEEAISCYLRTEMDVLVLGNFYCTDRNAQAISRAHERFSEQQAEQTK